MSATLLLEQYHPTSTRTYFPSPLMSSSFRVRQAPSMTDIAPADALRLLTAGINHILALTDPAHAAWHPPAFTHAPAPRQERPLSPPLSQDGDSGKDTPSPMIPLAPAEQQLAGEHAASLTPPQLEHESHPYADDKAAQRSVISRRFWSKSAPEIDIDRYLMRIHQYCPISTAVYLATSLYIYKLCVLTKAMPLTPLNAHRLVIAALRVACKNIEDINHPQKRFAKVGGMSEQELCRLEIGFLFLMDFDLKVDQAVLEEQAGLLMALEQ